MQSDKLFSICTGWSYHLNTSEEQMKLGPWDLWMLLLVFWKGLKPKEPFKMNTHTQYKPYHSFTVIIVLMIFWGIPGKPWLPFIHGPGMICFTYDQWRLRLWWWDRPSWVTWSNKFQNVGVYPNLILNSKIWIQRVSNHNSNVARAQIFGLYDKLWSDM